MIYVNFS